mmetsp:Transcript_82282/g.209122  ORF Transcript_82282/g.209122 Transcript_82282/m.209122 type:complete len:213 (-) Transcript_82282:227-865(-)|eukprot:CAMPEP_0183444732 /NCGR_PEP_ID=MMETSP0370-20130417/95884_1 /TAXON_ID=268820 /ORGANISM="Peridinium aciculiferum, Strain PAER-2" /LENGTH=212 /DNA_ID=CAMNT_0025635171 /DNA_START=181 /DNA_END=819 /DNA_ORIENTATION=+
MSAVAKTVEIDPESEYQPTCINVEGPRWEKFGYALIGGSTIIMICQAIGFGPAMVWKTADDVSTVLFTIELFVRIFEKGYLFCTEQDKNWNFFDSLVVAISIFSMIIAAKSAADNATSKGHGGTGNSAAMNKMKALRTLRLLRLLRLFRIFRGVEKVQLYVDSALSMVAMTFISIIIFVSGVLLILTFCTSIWVAATAWLRVHDLPSLPSIE